MPPSPRRVIEVQDQGDATLVRFIDPKIVDETIIAEIGEQLAKLVDLGRLNLRLDFTGVDYLASAMVGKLIAVHRKVKAANGRLTLCNVDSDLRESLEISRLDTFFDIEPGEKPAEPSV